jgi:Glycosyl transferase family 2
MSWSILIPTLSSRHAMLFRLLDVLLPQAEACPGVEVVGLHNDGNWPLAEIRQAMLEDAGEDYVSFIDDDDLVEPDYVAAVMACLERGPDCVAFWHALSADGVPDPREVRTGIALSASLQGWHEAADHYACNINHLSPVRTSLARKAGFSVVDGWEDRGYVQALQPLLRTQEEIPRALYHYLHRSSGTECTGLAPHACLPRPVISSPAFRWHHWSTG